MDNIIREEPLRMLARTHRHQIVYSRAKELNGIRLFENDNDFSTIQIVFLQYLESISSLYIDLAVGENLLTEEVIEDWIRADSYLLYKRKKREEQKLNGTADSEIRNSTTEKIVFIPGKKKGTK